VTSQKKGFPLSKGGATVQKEGKVTCEEEKEAFSPYEGETSWLRRVEKRPRVLSGGKKTDLGRKGKKKIFHHRGDVRRASLQAGKTGRRNHVKVSIEENGSRRHCLKKGLLRRKGSLTKGKRIVKGMHKRGQRKGKGKIGGLNKKVQPPVTGKVAILAGGENGGNLGGGRNSVKNDYIPKQKSQVPRLGNEAGEEKGLNAMARERKSSRNNRGREEGDVLT